MAEETSKAKATLVAQTNEVGLWYRWVILLITFSAFACAYMQRLGLGPLAPFIMTSLDITKAQIGLMSSAATIGYGVTLMPAGLVADRLGVRWTLSIGQMLAGVFMISMIFADTFIMGMVVMFGAGIGLGFIAPSVVRGIVTWFPLKERATAMGFNNISVNLGGMLTAATLPMIATIYGWRWGFVAIGVIAIVSGLLPAFFYRERTSGAGAPAAAPTAGAETAAAPIKKESSLMVFKSREIWLIICGGAALYVIEFAVLTFFVVYLKGHLLIPVVAAGFLLGSIDFGGVFGKPLAGLISDRIFHGTRKGPFIALSVIASVLAGVFALMPVGTPQWLILVCCVVFGFAAVGWGGIYFTMVGECAGKKNVAVVSGTCSLVVMCVTAVGLPIFGYLADKTGTWMWSWAYLVILGLVGTTALCFIREETRKIST
jgi:sugar phosphate permease